MELRALSSTFPEECQLQQESELATLNHSTACEPSLLQYILVKSQFHDQVLQSTRRAAALAECLGQPIHKLSCGDGVSEGAVRKIKGHGEQSREG